MQVTGVLIADQSLARPGRKQALKHVREARDFNNIETRAVIKFFFFLPLQGKAPKEMHAILTETLDCFLRGRAKDLSAPLYYVLVVQLCPMPRCLSSTCLCATIVRSVATINTAVNSKY